MAEELPFGSDVVMLNGPLAFSSAGAGAATGPSFEDAASPFSAAGGGPGFADQSSFSGGESDPALFSTDRRIGTVIADVTIEEAGRDELEITRHPVERGAVITDHAYKHPPELIIRCGWSDSGFGPGYSRAVYAALLDLQFSRQPMNITTGKRSYTNMLIQSITQTTDSRSENGLICTVVCRHIIIVDTHTTTVAPAAQQGQPQNTAETGLGTEQQPNLVDIANKPSFTRSITNSLGITTPDRGALFTTPTSSGGSG